MQTKSVVILSGARTPIGDFQGALQNAEPLDLACAAVNSALKKSEVAPEKINELTLGMLYKQGFKGNPARQIQLRCGMPDSGWAYTVDQQCASGMRAFENAAASIMLGKTEFGIAAGVESMSNAPYVLPKIRGGYGSGNAEILDSMLHDGLICAMMGYHMGVTAENLAVKYGISREEQDKLALESHRRAANARDSGIFDEETVPITVQGKRGDITILRDEHPKSTLTLNRLAELKPVFKPGGTVTAGNASGVNDGAAALVLAAEEKTADLRPLVRILSIANVGVAPEIMGIGPAFAIPKALDMAGLKKEDIGCFEINEAFAAQFIACNLELELDLTKVNINGSGIGLGHPVGCTGARIIVSLMHQMRRQNSRFGVASLCVGGGPAMAVVLELI